MYYDFDNNTKKMHKMAACIFNFYIENEILRLPARFELGQLCLSSST